jgi:signal peptidase I
VAKTENSLEAQTLKQKKNKKKSVDEAPLTPREEWTEFGKTAVVAIVIALAIRSMVIEPFNIPSGSMKPTLEVGDYLFVSKPAYGYSKYSFPMGLAPIDGRVMMGDREPKQGDVIVFKLPTNPRIDYIKRLVGMPGDQVQVKMGRLYINGKMVDREYVGPRFDQEGDRPPVKLEEYIETLPNGVKHSIYEENDNGLLDNTEIFTVPEGHYFFMGDNRDNSQDSRVESLVGFVPLENLVGRADLIFYSTNGTARLYEVWKWPWTIRYDRLFDLIGPKKEKEAIERNQAGDNAASDASASGVSTLEAPEASRSQAGG